MPWRFEEVFANGKKIETFEKHDSASDEILSKSKRESRRA